jgi:pentatricopeptide repeat protein
MLESEVTPSVVSYTTILHTHAREGNIQAAEKGLVHMGEKGVDKTFSATVRWSMRVSRKATFPAIHQLEQLVRLGTALQRWGPASSQGALVIELVPF